MHVNTRILVPSFC